uniref:Phosphatidate cytidylyltransferase, mitochondrial n=1 Tax=Fagus sylvatica TaxID=28930 RepID=A0A2N9FI34_FAGSY
MSLLLKLILPIAVSNFLCIVTLLFFICYLNLNSQGSFNIFIQVNILVDNLDIENVNSSNLRAAMSAALLLLPPKFSEEDLYAKICSLSYMGDLRMLFAEDRNKVKKIVQGQFGLFHSKYKPFLEEYEAKEFLRLGSSGSHQKNISQDCGSSVACSLVNSLPPMVRNQMGMKLGEKKKLTESGRIIREVLIGSREEAAKCMQKVLRRTVMVSSTRQAVSGLLAVGGVNAVREVFTRINKEDILIGELHDFDLH